MKTKLYTLTVFLIFVMGNVFAQTIATNDGEISGKVLDETQKDFPFASVSLLNAKDSAAVKGTLTTNRGDFQFKELKAGNYLVSVYVVGYKKIFRGPFVISGTRKKHSLDVLHLAVEAQTLKGVNIVKQKPLIERQIDKTVMNIENSTLAAGNSALEILAKAPGVTVDQDGKISLRGKQGVAIMLDGKPTYLSAEQLANLLRSTEGNAIQSIELITNPSAKYDASGNSGVINIKLKKNRNYGTNGSLLGGAGYGRYEKANAGLTLNHREKKINIFGNIDYGRNKRFGSTDIMRVNQTASDPTYFDQTSMSIRFRNNTNYKGGIDYFIDDQHTLGFTVNGYNSNGDNDADVLTLIGDRPGKTDSSVVARNINAFKYTGTSYNLNYKAIWIQWDRSSVWMQIIRYTAAMKAIILIINTSTHRRNL